MTLRQLFREFVFAKERRAEEHDRDIAHAWHVAAFSRQDKLPPLQKFLRGQPEASTETSPARERGLMQALSERLGIPMQKTRLIKKRAA